MKNSALVDLEMAMISRLRQRLDLIRGPRPDVIYQSNAHGVHLPPLSSLTSNYRILNGRSGVQMERRIKKSVGPGELLPTVPASAKTCGASRRGWPGSRAGSA